MASAGDLVTVGQVLETYRGYQIVVKNAGFLCAQVGYPSLTLTPNDNGNITWGCDTDARAWIDNYLGAVVNNYGCVSGLCTQGAGGLPVGCNGICQSPPGGGDNTILYLGGLAVLVGLVYLATKKG